MKRSLDLRSTVDKHTVNTYRNSFINNIKKNRKYTTENNNTNDNTLKDFLTADKGNQ